MKVYKCELCKGVVELAYGGVHGITCCGKIMTELTPNTTDGAKEKHLPKVERVGNKLLVQVGEVEHPMTEEHHIAYIVVEQGDKVYKANLDKTGKPSAEFDVEDGEVTVYEYCNLHGLWVTKA